MSVALKISDVEQDFSLTSAVTKECFDCDPDNPRAVRPELCKTCGGSRRQALAANDVAAELSASKTAPAPGKTRGGADDDLYLEY